MELVGMSQVVPAVLGLLGTVGTGIREGLASGTCWDVPCSPTTSWDRWDWDSRGSSLWDLLGCPMQSQHFLGPLGLGFKRV